MKNLGLLIALLFSVLLFAQMENVSSIQVGAYVNHTIVPLSPQSNLSHSQTIYYPEQLHFRGYINEISYFTPFSGTPYTNYPVDPANLTIKLGMTSVPEFDASTNFITDANLTEMIGILASGSGYERKYTFSTPFYYDGIQNLVIDVEDHNIASSSSAIAGFVGVNNFENPPTRSIISLTNIDNGGVYTTSVLKRNSFPKTKFYGNLERCYLVYATPFDTITDTSASTTISDDNISAFQYNYNVDGQPMSNIFETSSDFNLTLSGLLPAQKYWFHVQSDCNVLTPYHHDYTFTTRPVTLTVPHIIDFENGFQRDYVMSTSNFGYEVNVAAANNSTNGIELFGPGYPDFLSWNNYGDPFDENPNFIRRISLDVDLTQNTTNPILKLDLLQTSGTHFRIKINDFSEINNGVIDDFIYESITSSDTQFRAISIDLSDYVGQLITINLEHVSESTSRKTKIDNIILKENDCIFEPNIIAIATNNEVTVNWNSSGSLHDLVISEYNESPSQIYESTTNLHHNFDALNPGTTYKVFIRKNCGVSYSPWVKKLVTTEPTLIVAPYSEHLLEDIISNGHFSVYYNKASAISYKNSSSTMRMHQKNAASQWVGGINTTEYQAWNDNSDFVTRVKFKIDNTDLSDLFMRLKFKLYHRYNSNSTNSWFRILINGTQYGVSYNPQSVYQDPFTDINIDLTPYLNNEIEIELQQVGRAFEIDNLYAVSGDYTYVNLLELNGTSTATINDDLTDDAFGIYPNPSQEYLNIDSKMPFEKISIYDVTGKSIKNIQLSKFENKHKIGLKYLDNGMYFVVLQTKSKKVKKIFIKN